MTAPRTSQRSAATLPPAGVAVAPTFNSIALDQIRASSFNPRTSFDPIQLSDLADSIKSQGVLEPILVRPLNEGGYEIMAGERRYRAAALAGLAEIPAIVRVVTDLQARIIAVTENLQRSDLDPLDTARGYQILKAGGLSQGQIAEKCGVSEGEVSKSLALLELPQTIQEQLRSKELTPGHARVIQGKVGKYPSFAAALATHVAKQGYSVREVEDFFKGGDLPWIFIDQVDKSLVRRVDWSIPFKKECEACPHKALIGSLCLMPEEFDRKMAEFKAQEAEKAEKARLELKARCTALPVVNGKKATDLPKLADLQWNQYEQIFEAPAGCSETCECRCSAIGHHGKVVPICLDKARYNTLKAAATKEKNKEIKEAGKRKITRVLLLQHTDRDTTGRAYALALRKVLGGLYADDRRAAIPMLPTATERDLVRSGHFETIKAAFDHNGTQGPWEEVMPRLVEALGAISPIERNQVFLAAAGAVAIAALNEQIREPNYRRAEDAAFLLGAKEANHD